MIYSELGCDNLVSYITTQGRPEQRMLATERM
jgi:hypothetical protein